MSRLAELVGAAVAVAAVKAGVEYTARIYSTGIGTVTASFSRYIDKTTRSIAWEFTDIDIQGHSPEESIKKAVARMIEKLST